VRVRATVRSLGRVLIIEIGKQRLVNLRFAPKSGHTSEH
jgi:hypothetical protein